jgi:hypothetical protein
MGSKKRDLERLNEKQIQNEGESIEGEEVGHVCGRNGWCFVWKNTRDTKVMEWRENFSPTFKPPPR